MQAAGINVGNEVQAGDVGSRDLVGVVGVERLGRSVLHMLAICT